MDNVNLVFESYDLYVLVPVVSGLVSFIVYWFVIKSDRRQNRYKNEHPESVATEKFVLFTKYLGSFLLGTVPLVACLIILPHKDLGYYGLVLQPNAYLATLLWIIGLGLIVMPIALISAKRPENQRHYPQIRAKEWNRSLIVRNALAWVVYLFGYELLFRGVLLFPVVEAIGIWPAIAVNIVFYSSTHFPKGLAETVGAIPLSIVLCIATLQTGSIWVAFFVHVTMAWTNSYTALYYHPDMFIIRKVPL